jgi:adenine-specific DNA methylase
MQRLLRWWRSIGSERGSRGPANGGSTCDAVHRRRGSRDSVCAAWNHLERGRTWLEALPPYFGGKRKLCPRIFREIARLRPRDTWQTRRLVDPFLGGGSVSLYAKAQGFGVLCGDIAERSVIIGKALIENDGVHISEDDILRLFVRTEGNRHLIQSNYVPDHFAEATAGFLDNAFAAVDTVTDETKRHLLRLLLVKYIYWMRPHSKFSSPGAFNRPFAEERWDDIKATYKHAVTANASHPLPALRSLARDINRAVMRGAQACRAMRGNAVETIRTGEGADILYLDPPYSGTLCYEEEYRVLDEILGERHEPSSFSRRDGLAHFADLLADCAGFPLWVISYGNAVSDLDTVRRVVEQFRPAHAIEIAYSHMTAVASLAKREANREFIILAGEGVKR